MDMDTRVKLSIYDTIARTGRAPTASDVAATLALSSDDVAAAFASLHAKRLLVPEPGDATRIRMAPPFSGVETAFRVRSGGVTYDANCVWDALGVAAALGRDATIDAGDGHTGEPMTLEVVNGAPMDVPCVVHFAVPAARWWADIVHT